MHKLVDGLSEDAKAALSEMSVSQWYYTLERFAGVMDELVSAGLVEASDNPLSSGLRYRLINT